MSDPFELLMTFPATRWCYIDDCRKPATLIVESYPDDITLCEDHAFLHREDPWGEL